MRHALIAALLLLALPAPRAAAQDLYDLSAREPVVGLAVQTRMHMKGEKGVMDLHFDGLAIKGTIAMEMTQVETKRVLSVEDEVITEYTSRITEYAETTTTDFAGEQTHETEASPLLNHLVIWTLIDDKYIPELPDATEEQLEEMEAEPYNDTRQYPDEPVAVGHTWEMGTEAVVAILGEEMAEGAEGSADFEFVEIANFKGERCAKIKTHIVLKQPMAEKELDGMSSATVRIEMEGFTYRSLQQRIDVGNVYEGTLTIEGEGKIEGTDMTMTITIPMTFSGGEALVQERAEPAP